MEICHWVQKEGGPFPALELGKNWVEEIYSPVTPYGPTTEGLDFIERL